MSCPDNELAARMAFMRPRKEIIREFELSNPIRAAALSWARRKFRGGIEMIKNVDPRTGLAAGVATGVAVGVAIGITIGVAVDVFIFLLWKAAGPVK